MIDSVAKEIKDSIAKQIDTIFENKYPVYDRSISQSLDKPCFFIKVLDGDESRTIGIKDRYYKKSLHIVITGYTLDGDTDILNDMMDKLYDLEIVTLSDGSKILASKLSHKVEDGVLIFFVDYKLSIKKTNNNPTKLDDYDLNGGVKNEGK